MSKKVLFLMGLLLVAMITGITATESRIVSLGDAQGFIRDNTDIFRYPGSIFRYRNRVDLELAEQGSKHDWSMGANLPMKKHVFGVYINRPTGINLDHYFIPDMDDMKHSDYEWGDLDISKKIQFLYGFKEKFAVGFGMAMDSKSDPVPANGNEQLTMSAKYIELSGGKSGEKMDLGISLYLPMAAIKNEVSNEEDALSGMGLGLKGRYFFLEKGNLTAMALSNLDFSRINRENEFMVENLTEKREYTAGHFMFDLGVGANYQINENNTVILGVYPFRIKLHTETYPNMADHTKEDEYSESYLYVPEYKVAFESKLASWLTGRVGATQEYHFYTETEKEFGEDEVQRKEYRSSFNAELGFGIKIKRIIIDGVIRDDLLFNGPFFIGGDDPGLASKLSIGYEFN